MNVFTLVSWEGLDWLWWSLSLQVRGQVCFPSACWKAQASKKPVVFCDTEGVFLSDENIPRLRICEQWGAGRHCWAELKVLLYVVMSVAKPDAGRDKFWHSFFFFKSVRLNPLLRNHLITEGAWERQKEVWTSLEGIVSVNSSGFMRREGSTTCLLLLLTLFPPSQSYYVQLSNLDKQLDFC